MKRLAFDLSTRRGTIAFVEDGDILREENWPNDRRTAAPFFAALERFHQEFGPAHRLIVGLGPGSYTGTRIAISAAMGMQLTTGAELTGISSLTGISIEDEYVVIGDAKRASFFFARIRNGALDGNIVLLSEAEMSTRLQSMSEPVYTSDELPLFPTATVVFPSAALLCRQAGPANIQHAPLTPIYLREPHITVPRLVSK